MRSDVFIYVYDVIFILLFMCVVCNCAVVYNLSKKKVFLLLQWLFISFIIESTFETGYGIVTRSITAVGSRKSFLNYWYLLIEIIITGVENIITIYCLKEISGTKKKKQLVYAACFMAVVIGILGIAFLNILRPAQWYIAGKGINQIFQIGLLLMFCLPWHNNSKNVRLFYCWSFASLFLSILEIFLFANYERYINLNFPFYENHINFVEDFYYLFLAVVILFLTKKEREKYTHRLVEGLVQQNLGEFTAQKYQQKISFQKEEVREFCAHYSLTKREVEVMLLILQGKSNQDIADKLCITVGTVKVHVHNILNKMEISRRSQLLKKFLDYR